MTERNAERTADVVKLGQNLLGRVAYLSEEFSVVTGRISKIRMRVSSGARALEENLDYASRQPFGFGTSVCGPQQHGKVVERRRNIGVVGAECRFTN